MALPTRVVANADPYGEHLDAGVPVVQRPRVSPLRVIVAVSMVLVGVLLVCGTLALFWWPGLLIAVGVGLIGGAFLVRIDPGSTKRGSP